MSMLHDDSYNDGLDTGKRVAAGCVIATAAIIAVLGITFAMNRNEKTEIGRAHV